MSSEHKIQRKPAPYSWSKSTGILVSQSDVNTDGEKTLSPTKSHIGVERIHLSNE